MGDPPAADCPILHDSQHLAGLSQDMARTIRRIRRNLNLCDQCPSFADCAVLADLKSNVDTAIREVLSEMEITL